MPTNRPSRRSWIAALNEAAAREQIALPPMMEQGMGRLSWRDQLSDRSVSFRRRFVPLSEAERNGVDWALWAEAEGKPLCVASFREALYPSDARAASILSLLKGWLVDMWAPAEAREVISQISSQQVETPLPVRTDDREYWLSEDHRVGIIIEPDSWQIRSRTESLTSWRSRNEAKFGDSLPLSSLDGFIVWLAQHWEEIAHGRDHRPASLQHRGAAASRAYDVAQLDQSASTSEVKEWWSKHAIRAADEVLPNVFFERQADELLISWDATPSDERIYRISSGEQEVDVAFAVPVLRRLVQTRLRAMELPEGELSRLLETLSDDSTVGYAALSSYNSLITPRWLDQHGFSAHDAQQVALDGTSRHPIVGLLRSSFGTSINIHDYEVVMGMLQRGSDDSFLGLRSVAKGINSHVDVREPWESGYALARLIRKTLKLNTQDDFDIEDLILRMGVEIRDVSFSDPAIRGVCVGAPAYRPLIIINDASPDASGPSGRRITLAHELCHLLFDRSRLRNLARFDWDGAENDRLLEIRANAFAVELFVPMDILVKPDGKVLEDGELLPITVSRRVSISALRWHVENLRNRLLKQ